MSYTRPTLTLVGGANAVVLKTTPTDLTSFDGLQGTSRYDSNSFVEAEW